MYIDRIDIVLPEADIASILAAYTGAETLLEPLPSVSKADRKHYAKLGLKNEALALQIIEVGRANPDLIPRGIDFEMIDRDITAREQLKLLKIQLQRMLERVDDAMLLLGVDVYAAALSMYHCLRRNADTTSLKETVDELRKGFARPSRKKKADAEPAPPAQETSPAPAIATPVESPRMQSSSATPSAADAIGTRSPGAPVRPTSKGHNPPYPIPSSLLTPIDSFLCSPHQLSGASQLLTLLPPSSTTRPSSGLQTRAPFPPLFHTTSLEFQARLE